jgi:hypothetical protein
MSRIVPFDENEICDNCGVHGAFDFMGDFLCGDCAHKYIEPEYDDECEDAKIQPESVND